MAPVALDPFPASLRAQEQIASLKKAAATAPNQYGTEISRLSISELEANSKAKAPVDWNENYSYKEWLPWFDERYKRDDFKDPAYEPFEHTDVGLRALHHLNPRSFLDKAAALDDLSPRFGTSVKGIDVTSLSSDELDQLALYVAERGVVVLEDQHAFINQSPEKIKEFGRHFSPRLHQHQVSGQPRDHPEFHLIYKSHKVELNNYEHRNEYVPTVWHSDVSYELNPPGITGLFLFSTPDSGGDTLFSDTEEHLRRLSPAFKELLKGLHAEHSGVEQAENAKQGGQGVVKRQPIITTHPVLRTHPVTGRESIYVNKGFTKRIVELKKPESDAILDVLFRLNADAIDAQIRVRWRAGSLVLWDNRRTLHTPTVDFSGESARRHGARITPAAERPFYRRTDK